jgi:hypothetical protein
MTRVCSLLIVSIITLAACGGGDDGGSPPLPDAPPPPPDATPLPDAPPPVTVVPVPCTGPFALNVTVLEPPPYQFGFTPAPAPGAKPTVPAGSVVRFDMQRNHNAVSGVGPNSPDGRFTAARNEVSCLRFDSPGEFSFYCGNHAPEVALHQASLVVTAN